MATLQIHSNNTDDLYLLNEMARRMNLKTEMKTEIAPPENKSSIGNVNNDLKKENKKLVEMAFLTSGATLEKFFEEETEKMF